MSRDLPTPGVRDDRHEPRRRRAVTASARASTRPRAPSSRPTSGGASANVGVGGAAAHADEPVGGYRLGLALQLERLDLLDLDVVADEPVRQRAEKDLALAGRLLEAGRDVDRVAGDEPLARGRVAGDDLARVDAGAVREADAVGRLELDVELLERRLHARRPRARRGGRRPRGAGEDRRRPSRRRR